MLKPARCLFSLPVAVLLFFFSIVLNGPWAVASNRGDEKRNSQGSFLAGEKTIDTEEPVGAVTLENALVLAIMRNPELAAFSLEIRAREAKTLQAGLLPNPELEVGINEFGGSSQRNGFDASETTLGVSQLVELGGKRSRRTKAAAFEKTLGEWDYLSKRLDVIAETKNAFFEVLAAQARLSLAGELHDLAGAVHEVVYERVKAGRVSPIEESKAKVELSAAAIQLEKSRRSLEAARERLAATWAGATARFTRAEGELEPVVEILPVKETLQKIGSNPDIARWATEIESRNAALELEKAKKTPDFTIRAGMTRFEDADEQAFLLGFSIDLPLFDRNQGGILEARRRIEKSAQERKAADVLVKRELSRVHEGLKASYNEAVTLKNDVLPAAQHAFNAVREGYREGKFTYLEVLDAQRTVFATRSQFLDALISYQTAYAELERLTGNDSVSRKPNTDKRTENE